MNYKFKTFLPIIMSMLLFSFASPCLAQLPIKVTVNNNTQNYVIAIGSASGFSPGRYSYSANFNNYLRPGNSGIVTIMPDQTGLLGQLLFGVRSSKYDVGQGINILLAFWHNNKLLNSIVYTDLNLKGKVFVNLEGMTPQWLPGQNITITVTDLISKQ